MNNIFNTIVGKLPKASQEQKDLLKSLEPKVSGKPKAQEGPLVPSTQPAPTDFSAVSTVDLVAAWQKDNTPEQTAELLRRMKPTISSAMTSYAPGMERKLSVKAANLTLDALRNYDPKYGANPSTYVFTNLKRLSRLGNNRSNIIPTPESYATDRKYLDDMAARFEDSKGREPSVAELADLTGMSMKRITMLLSGNAVTSESATLTEDSYRDTVLMNKVTDDDYYEYVYMSTDPINQQIMDYSSGKHGRPRLSSKEIASRLHITPAAVSQRSAKIRALMSEARELV